MERRIYPAERRRLTLLPTEVGVPGEGFGMTHVMPVADIEQGCISSASCILANVSLQLGRSLTWDPAKGQVVGDEEANRLLRRPYRAPWVHPEAAKV